VADRYPGMVRKLQTILEEWQGRNKNSPGGTK
jgi:hypothetical protein